MNTHYDNGRQSDDGFIYVASRDRIYYELGLLSCQSLKDFYPDSHVTLFTHQNFVDDRAKIFDRVITNIPIHYRTKMWCMARTPYKRTIYNDCDSIIQHRDIKKMHGFLDDCDMFFGTCLWYTVGNLKWAHIDKAKRFEPLYHGSMCGYHSTPLLLDFMQTWFDKYLEQRKGEWAFEDFAYKEWQQFDMFTLWRMTCKRYPEEFGRFDNLNIKLLPRRYNTTGQDLPQDLGGKPVITQVDKGTWRKIPSAWSIIEKGIKDEKHQVSKSSPASSTFEFN